MALWGKKDQANNAPTWLREGAHPQNDLDNATVIDTDEATAQKLSSGWTMYKEYGNGRKYIETLVAMRVTPEQAEPDAEPPEEE